jgi:hypothetical protein
VCYLAEELVALSDKKVEENTRERCGRMVVVSGRKKGEKACCMHALFAV